MLNGGLLQVTGRGTNVNFTIDDQAPFEAVIAGVEEYLGKNRHLFSRGNITVNVGRRILAREQLTQIKRILEAESGLTVVQFWCSPEILEETLSDIGPGQPAEVLEESPSDIGPGQPAEVLEETPLDIGPGQSAEVPNRDTQIKSQGLTEYRPDSEILPGRWSLKGSEEPDQATDSPGPTLPWSTPYFSNLPGPFAAAPPFAEKEELAEAEKEPLPPEDSQDLESQSSPEPAACDDSEGLAEPAAQISAESVGDPIPEPSPETIKEPIIEPSLLELAVMGLEQSIAEGGLDVGEGGSSAFLDSRLESLSLEVHSGEADQRTDAPIDTGVGTSISPHQETGGLNRQNEALLIKTTCRSGEVVRYPGDVVILADVNPGAEIIADGDILVFGSLRGLAHAGAGGDIQATIIALNLEAPRIQIGPYIGMAPKAKKRSKSNRPGPTLAFVRRQHILVAPFKGRFAGYSGGTIYDG